MPASTIVPPPAGLSDGQPAVERLDAGAQPGEPRAGRIGAAAAVVADHDDQGVGLISELHPAAGRPGVLDGVRQRLRDHEVGRTLDRWAKPALCFAADRRADLIASRERLDGRDQPAVGEQRRHDPAGEVPQLADRAMGFPLCVVDQASELGLALDAQLRPAELHRERDEPRLGTVVQVALDAPQFGRLRVDRLAAGVGERLDPCPQRAAPVRDEHPVVQREQRVGAAGGRQAEQRPRRPERLDARQQPRQQPREDQDHRADADERPHACHPPHRPGRMAPRPARGPVEHQRHAEPEPRPRGPEVSLSVERPDRAQQDRDEQRRAGT